MGSRKVAPQPYPTTVDITKIKTEPAKVRSELRNHHAHRAEPYRGPSAGQIRLDQMRQDADMERLRSSGTSFQLDNSRGQLNACLAGKATLQSEFDEYKGTEACVSRDYQRISLRGELNRANKKIKRMERYKEQITNVKDCYETNKETPADLLKCLEQALKPTKTKE